MSDLMPVQELNALDQLVVKESCLFLRQSIFTDDIVEKFAALSIFHDQVLSIARFNDFVQFDDVAMFDICENLDFSIHSALVGHHGDFLALKNLNSNLLFGSHVDAQFDLAKSSLAQIPLHLILAYLAELALWALLPHLLIVGGAFRSALILTAVVEHR